jgi:DNA-binding MarR family transcriptional regulator
LNESVAQTSATIARILDQACGDQLTLAQYRTLGAIACGSERASRLAKALAVGPPVVSERVDGLVERGFVSRETPSTDRRAITLRLTVAGRAAFDRADGSITSALDNLLGRCADPEMVRAALVQLGDVIANVRVGKVSA